MFLIPLVIDSGPHRPFVLTLLARLQRAGSRACLLAANESTSHSRLVMPVLEDIVANVTVDGVPLPEYAESTTVDAQGVTVVACWVPSQAGKVRSFICLPPVSDSLIILKAFTVRWRDTRPWQARPCIAGKVYADGESMGGKLLKKDEPHRGYSEIVGRNCGGVRRALVFSELNLTGTHNPSCSYYSVS
jgi:hypothetical protein